MAAAAGGNNTDDFGRVYNAVVEGKSPDEVRNLLQTLPPAQRAAAANRKPDDTPIQAAHRLGRGELIAPLLEAGADASVLPKPYSNPVALCIRYGLVDTLRTLISSGQADANQRIRGRAACGSYTSDEAFHCSPAHFCLVPGHNPDFTKTDPQLGCLEVLAREFGGEVDALDSMGESPLSWVPYMASQHEAAVDLLLRLGADPRGGAKAKSPPIVEWCWHSEFAPFEESSTPCIRRIVESGAPTTGVDKRGRPLLSIAAAKGNADLVRYLIGVQGVHVRTVETEETALHYAANAKVAAALLDAGADIEAKDVDGRTPVFACAETWVPAALELLLERGASPDVVDLDGYTPIMTACSHSDEIDWSFFDWLPKTAELLLQGSPLETLRAVTFDGRSTL